MTAKQKGIQIHDCFPASTKVYVEGSRPDIRVPMREIALSPTITEQGEIPNEPIRVYDTSGVYTDPTHEIDIEKGLPRIREQWILERGDVEEYEGREVKPEDNVYRPGKEKEDDLFPLRKRKPLRAKRGEKCDANALCETRNCDT